MAARSLTHARFVGGLSAAWSPFGAAGVRAYFALMSANVGPVGVAGPALMPNLPSERTTKRAIISPSADMPR